MKKRNPVIALLLSILTPGLGQVYNGQIVKGGIIFFSQYLFLFILSFSDIFHNFRGMVVFIIFAIFYHLYIYGDALIIARKIREIELTSYNRWYFYILIIILSAITNNNTNPKELLTGVKAYKVPAGSMVPTVLAGDWLVADLNYYKNNKFKIGDIIVFQYPLDESRDFIKRIVANSGDKLEIRAQKVYINDNIIDDSSYAFHSRAPLPRNSILTEGDDCLARRDNYGPIVIPDNKLFVMGDHRENSKDSRCFGAIDVSKVRGKALYIYWSWDADASGILNKVRWYRIGKGLN